MRSIDKIIIHCSATREGRDVSAAQIREWHTAPRPRGCGWKDIGYHYVIRLDGTIERGRREEVVGAHTSGHNAHSIGVCYVGGCDALTGAPKDTRTAAQRWSLHALVNDLCRRYPGVTVHGHNEFSSKACPCFNVGKEFVL